MRQTHRAVAAVLRFKLTGAGLTFGPRSEAGLALEVGKDASSRFCRDNARDLRRTSVTECSSNAGSAASAEANQALRRNPSEARVYASA